MPSLQSERGKEILAWATTQDYCVLEFQEQEDGSMMISDITEHVEKLEQEVNSAGPE